MEYCKICGKPKECDGKNVCDECMEKRKPQATQQNLNLSSIETLSSPAPRYTVEPKNIMASILKVLGWITIVLGIIIGIYKADDELDSLYFIIIALPSVISGILFIAFGEVIYLLQSIRNKMK